MLRAPVDARPSGCGAKAGLLWLLLAGGWFSVHSLAASQELRSRSLGTPLRVREVLGQAGSK